MVEFRERELEDYVFAHIDELPWFYEPRVIGRQVACTSGIIDLLVRDGIFLTVIELKSISPHISVVAQASGYAHSVRLAWSNAIDGVDRSSLGKREKKIASELFMMASRSVDWIVIAPDFKKSVLRSIQASGTAISTQKNEDGSFSFKNVDDVHEHVAGRKLSAALAPELSDCIRELAIYRAENKMQQLEREIAALRAFYNAVVGGTDANA